MLFKYTVKNNSEIYFALMQIDNIKSKGANRQFRRNQLFDAYFYVLTYRHNHELKIIS